MNTHTLCSGLLLGSLMGTSLATRAAWSQEAGPRAEVPVTPAAVAVPARATGAARAWRDDARLGGTITLEARRMPLAEVLAALSKRSGVELDGGALSATKRVTLSVQDMNVRDVMSALEDLYQASWQARGAAGYVLQERQVQPWQRSLAQLGNIDNWGFYNTNWSRPFAPPYLTPRYAFDWQALMNELGEDKLQSPEGVLFSSLPPKTQSEIRRLTSWGLKHQAIEALAVREAAEHDWTLMIKPANYPRPSMSKIFKVRVPTDLGPLQGEITSDDRPLASFPLTPIAQSQPKPLRSQRLQPQPPVAQ